jgi:hypothetical protein
MSYAIAPFLLGLLVGLLSGMLLSLAMRITIIRYPIDDDHEQPAQPIIGTCANCGFPAEEDGEALPCGCVYCGICADRDRHLNHPADCAGPQETP